METYSRAVWTKFPACVRDQVSILNIEWEAHTMAIGSMENGMVRDISGSRREWNILENSTMIRFMDRDV
jgi:hypothetical protein